MTPGKGLGIRETVTVSLRDLMKHDRDQDPYHATRSAAGGTWFGRLIARNPFYQSRVLRVRTGFLTKPFDWGNFQDREYLIESINGPDSKGNVTIIAKDLLTKALGNKAQIPEATSGALTADITAGATSLSVTAGTGSEYGASGYVRIGAEIIAFSGRSTDTLTGLTRGQWGSVAAAHKIDDGVQLCYALEGTNAVDFTETLLTDFAGISSSYIPSADWTTEKETWLSNYNLTSIITKPIPVEKVLAEITDQCLYNIWWDSIAMEIKLKALAPPDKTQTLTDNEDLIADTVRVREDPKQRLSRILVYTDPIDWTEIDKAENFKSLYVQADLSSESDEKYGEKQIRTVLSRWLNSSQSVQYVGRTFGRFSENPKFINARVPVRAMPAVGDLLTLQTRMIQDETGSPDDFSAQVISVHEDKPGHSAVLELMTGAFRGRYGRIMLNTANDYGSATEDELDFGGYIGPNSGNFSDGGERYKII
jgi:hypothetical protein